MAKELTIPCMFSSTDTLRVMTGNIPKGDGGSIVMIQTRVDPNDKIRHRLPNQSIMLDEEHVRELFNWLGVWLHGGHRDG